MPTVIRRPNADGTPTGYEWSPTTTPDYYDEVDEEVSDGDTTTLSTLEDLVVRHNRFLKDALSLPSGATITAVRLYARCRQLVSAFPCDPYIRLGFYDGATDEVSGAIYITNTDWNGDLYSYEWTTSPFTGNPWTETEIDNLELVLQGVSCRRYELWTYWYTLVICTQLWLEVDYTVPAPPGRAGLNISQIIPIIVNGK